MVRLLLAFLFLGVSSESICQKKLSLAAVCSYYGEKTPSSAYAFNSDREAEEALKMITDASGLSPNFTLLAANVPNASALVMYNERYILYNQTFMYNIRQKINYWASISILAHEVGHHLNGHSLQPGGSRPNLELQADKFSGFILAKLGANLDEAQSAIHALIPEEGSLTHPGRSSRLAAIANGWYQANGNTSVTPSPAKRQTVGGYDRSDGSTSVAARSKSDPPRQQPNSANTPRSSGNESKEGKAAVAMLKRNRTFVLNGSGFSYPDGTVVSLIRNGDPSSTQESKIVDGRFVFNIPLNEADLYFVQIAGLNRPIELFLEPGQMNIRPNQTTNGEYEVTGSVVHSDFRDFVRRFLPIVQQTNQLANAINTSQNPASRDSLMIQYQATQANLQAVIDSVVDKKPSSPVTTFILSATYGFNQDPIALERRYNKLDSEQQQSTTGKRLLNLIEESKVGSIGSVAINFTQNDVDGNPVTLSSFRGKYVLVDFWASWCGPCRAENPNVVDNYQRFKNKNFTVLGVSLDREGQKDRWLEAIQKDKLTWTHVSDLKFWNNEVAKLYKVQSIPQNLLIDPNGIIIAKNLRGQDLGKKLCEVLGCD